MAEWKRVKIGKLCDIIKGETGLASSPPGQYPLVATGKERRTCATWQFDTDAVCVPLVSSTGHGKKTLNYVHYESGKFALGTILAAVIPKDSSVLTARFLYLYLSHFKDTVLVPLMKGAANVSLSMKEITSVEIPVPPLDEQQNLIDLIFRIEDEHRELLSETNRQRDLLKQLRQTVLQDAVEGKLTTEWRMQHPVAKGNPQYDAAALLAQIKAEKERLVKAGELRQENLLSPIVDSDKTFEIPYSWVWCRMGDVCRFITKGTTPAPNELKKEGEIPFLKVYNMVNQKIDFYYKPQYISTKQHQQFARSRVVSGDVLMNIVGPPLGKIARVPQTLPECNINQAIAIFSSPIKPINEYLYLYWTLDFCSDL